MLRTKTTIVIIMTIFSSNHCSIIIDNINPLDMQLAYCVLNISRTYFPKDKPVIIQLPTGTFSASGRYAPEPSEVLMKLFVSSFKLQVINCGVLDDEMLPNKYTLKPPSAVLILTDKSLENMFALLGTFFFRISLHFGLYPIRVVIITTFEVASKWEQFDIAHALVNEAWVRFKIYNVVVLVQEPRKYFDEENLPAVDIFTWFPKLQNNNKFGMCLNHLSVVTHLDIWVSKDKGFLLNENLFPLKQLKDMNQCPTAVEMNFLPPLGIFLNKIMKTENSKVMNGVYVGILTVLSELTQVNFALIQASNFSRGWSICPVFLRYFLFGEHTAFDCILTRIHFQMSLKLYVTVSPVPSWQSLTKVFSPVMWLLILVTYIQGCVVFWFVGRYPISFQGILDVVFLVLQSFLGITVIDNHKGYIAAGFLILWLFFCMQIYTAYMSMLTGRLIDPGDFPAVNDLEELQKSNFNGWTTMKLQNEDIGIMKKIFPNYEECIWFDCLKILTTRQKAAVLGDSYMFDLFTESSPRRHGRKRMIKMDSDLITNPVCCYMKLGCLYADIFNTVTARLLAAGITNKWLQEIGDQISRENRINENDDPEALSLVHLQGPFYVLLVGFVFSCV
ncbi:Ionotropic receptor 554, partial [Blattella germanica]